MAFTCGEWEMYQEYRGTPATPGTRLVGESSAANRSNSRLDGRLAAPLWLYASLISYAVALFAPQVLSDSDTYSHVATGRWILLHRAVPMTDPFSFTFSGAPWVAHEWLSEVIMAATYLAGGWYGEVILFACVTSLAAALLARHLTNWLDPFSATIGLMIAAICVSRSLLARPHILVLPIMELWAIGLLNASERRRVPWMMLPLMLAWANMHGSFVLGLVLVTPFAAEATWSSDERWPGAAPQWLLFLACAAALASMNPHGWRGLVFPLQLMSMKQLGSIFEWRVPDFQSVQPVELALMTMLYVCLSQGVRVPAARLLVLMGLVHLALQHNRHQMLAGVLGALVLAEPLGRAFGLPPRLAWESAWSQLTRSGWFAVIAVMLAILRSAYPAAQIDTASIPTAAVDHVPADLVGRPVLNDYAFGGYLIYRGIRPYIDGRADMYGDVFLGAYLDTMRPNLPCLTKTLEQYGIQWTILSAGSPALEILDTLPGWHRLYTDEVAVVHIRTDHP